MGSHLKKFWATHVTWIGALIGFLDPSVQNWLASPSHIKYAVLVGGAWAILLHNLTAPKNADTVAEAKGTTA